MVQQCHGDGLKHGSCHCRYWGLLQKLDQLTEPLAVRSAMGKLPSNEPWKIEDVATHGRNMHGLSDGIMLLSHCV